MDIERCAVSGPCRGPGQKAARHPSDSMTASVCSSGAGSAPLRAEIVLCDATTVPLACTARRLDRLPKAGDEGERWGCCY